MEKPKTAGLSDSFEHRKNNQEQSCRDVTFYKNVNSTMMMTSNIRFIRELSDRFCNIFCNYCAVALTLKVCSKKVHAAWCGSRSNIKSDREEK